MNPLKKAKSSCLRRTYETEVLFDGTSIAHTALNAAAMKANYEEFLDYLHYTLTECTF
jgi:hypothetical protein